MAEGDFLGDLSYGTRERRYVAPPQSTNQLLVNRENDYLTSLNNKRVLDGMLANLPYAPQDKPLYEELVNSTNSFLGSITPENMADNVLNTQQFASDFINKKGGKQLIDNYTQYQSAIKAIDENKDIADPAMRDWYKSKIAVTPVTKSETTGMYQSGRVKGANVAPYVNVADKLLKAFEGIKADGAIQENPDGTVTILKPVPGYLQYNVGEKVTRERLQEGLLSYIQQDTEASSYMGQRAEFLAATQPNDIVSVFNRLTPEQKTALLGNENATVQDYQSALLRSSNSVEDARNKNTKLLQQIVLSEEQRNAMTPALAKYVYSNIEPKLIEDKMLLESLKFQAEIAKANAKPKATPDDLSSVSIQGWNTIQSVNPADIELLDTRRTEIQNLIPQKQAELIQYQLAVNNGTPGYTSERLADMNLEMQSLDKESEEIELQKRQIKDNVLDTASKKGINIEDQYKKSLPKLREIQRKAQEQGTTLKVPTLEEYSSLIVDRYTNPNKNNNFIDSLNPFSTTKESYLGDIQNNNGFAFTKEDALISNQLEKVAGEFKDIKVTKDLSYITSVGETNKQSIKALNNYKKSVQQNFSNNPEAFQVGDKALGSWLEENLDIDNLRTMIDWKNSTIEPLLQRDRQNGQLYGVNLKLTKEGESELSDADKYALTNSIKVPVTYHGVNKEIQDAEVQHVLTTAFKDMMNSDRTPHNVNLMKSAGEMYVNTTPLGKTIDNMNLYVMPAGESRTLNVEGEDIEIQSVARTARGTNLNNTDFRVYRGSGSEKQVLVLGENGANWQNAKQAETSGARIDFNTPSDIKQVLGAGQLYNQVQKSKAETPVVNPYEQYLNKGTTTYKETGYKLVSENDIQLANYSQYSRSLQSFFTGTASTIPLVNGSGKTAYINARVPLNSLTDLRTIAKDKVASNVQYPYINNNIVGNVQNILNNYDVLVSGGFRGEDSHNFLKGSNKNSPHKYGFGLDFDDNDKGNEFFNQVKNDPSLADKLGIARILKENDHIHVEFKTNMI